MLESKIKNQKSKIKITIQNSKFLILSCSFAFYVLSFVLNCYAGEEFTYDAKGKRNPFIPLVTSDGRLIKLDKEENKSELLLEGIIYDKNGLSYAIINGGVFKIGDIIGNYQVLKIKENSVVFIKEGQMQEIELKKEEE